VPRLGLLWYSAGRRLAIAVPTLLGASFVVFAIVHVLPGDPVEQILGKNATRAQIISLRHQLGLDRPFFLQYFSYLGGLIHGDLGTSIRSGLPVGSTLMTALPNTLELSFCSLVFGVVVGIAVGIAAGVRSHGYRDTTIMVFGNIGNAIPGFWLGILLILGFAIELKWLPPTSAGGIDRGLILPVITLGWALAAVIARLVRTNLVTELSKEYVLMARATGVSEVRVVTHHALRNALVPLVTVIGLQFGWLLGGAAIIEIVYARPGIGQLLLQAILDRDYPIIQGAVLLATAVYIGVNFLVDVAYGVIDPRMQ
jgi:peptide/nickel transport system permease protein